MKQVPLLLFALLLAFTLATPANAIPVAVIAATFDITSTFVAIAATFIINTAIAVGLSLLINVLFGPKNNRQAAIATLAIGEQPRVAIFGICAVAGTLE